MLVQITPTRFVNVESINTKRFYVGKGRPKASEYLLNDIKPRERAAINKMLKAKRTKRIKVVRKRSNFGAYVLAFVAVGYMALGVKSFLERPVEFVSPLVAKEPYAITEVQILEPKVEEPKADWSGVASYYSEDGCIGCHPQLIMANGKRFKDEGITVAFNRLPLGSFVEVKNKLTGKKIVAEVTDTGGFESLGRIIDLSPAVKNAIKCTDLCDVEIRKI